jgi:hypothetical protein
MRTAATCRFWVVLVCLLALSLPPAATAPQGQGRLENTESGPAKVLFAAAPGNAASVLPAGEKKPRQHGIDKLLAILHRQLSIVSQKVPPPFLSDENADVAHRADRAAIPIRAPPRRLV